jgi:hypothetical protein
MEKTPGKLLGVFYCAGAEKDIQHDNVTIGGVTFARPLRIGLRRRKTV